MKRKNVSERIHDRLAPLRLQRVKSVVFEADMKVWIFMTHDNTLSIVRDVRPSVFPRMRRNLSSKIAPVLLDIRDRSFHATSNVDDSSAFLRIEHHVNVAIRAAMDPRENGAEE